jgi:hypothetical protein
MVAAHGHGGVGAYPVQTALWVGSEVDHVAGEEDGVRPALSALQGRKGFPVSVQVGEDDDFHGGDRLDDWLIGLLVDWLGQSAFLGFEVEAVASQGETVVALYLVVQGQ